jgi:hypothetical protein
MDGRSDLERSLRRRIGAISGGLPFRSRSLPVSRAELPCAATGICDRRHREPMRQLARVRCLSVLAGQAHRVAGVAESRLHRHLLGQQLGIMH